MNIQNYAVSGGSPRRAAPSRRPQGASPLSSNYIVWGLILLAVLILIPLLWSLLGSGSAPTQVPVRSYKTTPEPKYYEEIDSEEFRLDLSKFKEDMSMNEFVNKELARILPGIDLNDKFSVFLSSDISEKLMKLYHDESLNLFKTKVDEYEIHKNILKEKYNKGKIIGEALLKEIDMYEGCHPALHDIKDKLVHLVNQYNNIFRSKSDYDSNFGNFLAQIKSKEAELTKLKREYENDKGHLETSLYDLRYPNTEDKLRRDIERLKSDTESLRKLLKESPEKVESRNLKLFDLRRLLGNYTKEMEDLLSKKEELNEIAKGIEQEAKELSSKEILDILRSDYNSRIQKLQKLAQNILESANFEKNEVYFHRMATPEEKKRSIKTLDGIKARYRYILQLIIKVSYKLYLRTKNQAKSDEKANTYQSIYAEIRTIENKIEGFKLKIQETNSQLKKLQDEINLYGDQAKEKEDQLLKNEAALDDVEAKLKELLKNIGSVKDQMADLQHTFEEKEKAIKNAIERLEEEKKEYDKSKTNYSESLNKAYKEFIESATALNKKINDCKINENLLKRMIENFLSFSAELEKFDLRKENLQNEIRKMYESLENQANLPDHL